MKPDTNVRPLDIKTGEDRQPEGAGVLVHSRSRISEGDFDLVGEIRLDGRLYRLRGWLLEPADGPPLIRLHGVPAR